MRAIVKLLCATAVGASANAQVLDTCEDALPLGGPGLTMPAVSLNNTNNTATGPAGSCNRPGTTTMQNSQWYSVTPEASGTMSVLLEDQSGFDMIVAVYSGPCGNLTEIACGHEPEPIMLDVEVNAGQTYYIAVGDWGVAPEGGNCRLEFMLPEPPEHDDCADALTFASIPFVAELNNDTNTASGPPGICNTVPAITMQNSQWFRFFPADDSRYHVFIEDLPQQPFDMIATVLVGNCGEQLQVDCADEPEPLNMRFDASPGVGYTIVVGDDGTLEGGGDYRITIDRDCAADINDDGVASPADFTAWLNCFQFLGAADYCYRADVNLDGGYDPADFTAWLSAFNVGCP